MKTRVLLNKIGSRWGWVTMDRPAHFVEHGDGFASKRAAEADARATISDDLVEIVRGEDVD